MNIGIVGNGVVGGALAKTYLGAGHDVLIHDLEPTKSEHTLGQVMEMAEVIFLCLPTPLLPGAGPVGLNTHFIHSFFKRLVSRYGRPGNFGWQEKHYVLKSTTPIGTTRQLATEYGLTNLLHSPEFLTARTAEEDAANPRITVIGKPGGWHVDRMTSEELTTPGNRGLMHEGVAYRLPKEHPVIDLFYNTWPGGDFSFVTSDESEATKLLMNAFFAVKVAFWNEARSLCDKLGCNYREVIDTILAEGRIYPLHTQVPGPDGHYGFGGTCLPKDLAQVAHSLMLNGLDNNVTAAALLRNTRDRKRMV